MKSFPGIITITLVIVGAVWSMMTAATAGVSANAVHADPGPGAAVVYGVGSTQSDDDTDVRDLPTTGRGTGVVEESSSSVIPAWQTIQSVLVLALVAILAFAGLALHARYQRL